MRQKAAILVMLAATLLAAGCGPELLGTRSIEERFLNMGYANRSMAYGDYLAKEGRLPEALAAYRDAENSAYTSPLRFAARARRIYLEQAIEAYQHGQAPPAPPVLRVPEPPSEQQKAAAEGRATGELPEAAPPIYPLGMTPPLPPASGAAQPIMPLGVKPDHGHGLKESRLDDQAHSGLAAPLTVQQ